MNRKNRNLTVWQLTGNWERHIIVKFGQLLVNPIFLILVAIVSIVIMLSNELWRIWVVPISTIGLAILIALAKSPLKRKIHQLKWERLSKKYNHFENILHLLEYKYTDYFDIVTCRTKEDNKTANALYRQIFDTLLTFELYQKIKCKIKRFTGNEYTKIKVCEYYTDFILSTGEGRILFIPSVDLIAKIRMIDEAVIKNAMREIGLIEWSVELIKYEESVLLFVLKQNISRAYNFIKED